MDDSNQTRPFALRQSRLGDVLVLAVFGEVDIATAPELAQAVRSVSMARRVVIDLTGTTFIDSTGIHALEGAHRELVKQEVELSIIRPADRLVSRVFEIAGLPDPQVFFDSIGTALTEEASTNRESI